MTRQLFDLGLGGNSVFKVEPLIASGTYTFALTQGAAKGCYSFPSLSAPQCSLRVTDFGWFLSPNRISMVVKQDAADQVSAVLYLGVLLIGSLANKSRILQAKNRTRTFPAS